MLHLRPPRPRPRGRSDCGASTRTTVAAASDRASEQRGERARRDRRSAGEQHERGRTGDEHGGDQNVAGRITRNDGTRSRASTAKRRASASANHQPPSPGLTERCGRLIKTQATSRLTGAARRLQRPPARRHGEHLRAGERERRQQRHEVARRRRAAAVPLVRVKQGEDGRGSAGEQGALARGRRGATGPARRRGDQRERAPRRRGRRPGRTRGRRPPAPVATRCAASATAGVR